MGNKKTTDKKNLKDLKNYLKTRLEKEEKNIKPEPWTSSEMSDFLDEIVIPAFDILRNEMLEYNFDAVDYTLYVKKAVLKVADPLTHFIFKVEINNSRREVKIYYIIKHRIKRRTKLLDTDFSEFEVISFNEIEKINKDFIISLFTKWFIKKDELINTFGNNI